MHKIDEMCDLGAHANLIVPPSWVVKLPKRVRAGLFCIILFNYFLLFNYTYTVLLLAVLLYLSDNFHKCALDMKW